jgi:hypothetical protein
MIHADENDLAFLKRPSVVFFLLIPILVLVFRSFLGFNGLYGQDAHEYLRYSRALIHYVEYGDAPGHFHWPVLYPFVGALLCGMFDHSEFGMQLISIVSFSASLYFLLKIIHLVHKDTKMAFTYVLCFGMLSAYFLRLGVCSMSDMFAIFFVTLTLYLAIRYYYQPKPIYFISAFFFALTAVLTRYACCVVLFIPLAAMANKLAQHKKAGVVVIFAFLFAAWAVPGSLMKFGLISEGDVRAYIGDWSFRNLFKREFVSSASGTQHYFLPNGLFNLLLFVHPGFMIPGIVLFLYIKRFDLFSWTSGFFFWPMLVYIIFLSGFPLQNTRLLTLAFPFLLLFYYPAFLRVHERWLKIESLRLLFFSGILAAQAALFYFAFNDFYFQNKLEQEIGKYINGTYGNTGITIYTSGMSGPLRTYGITEGVYELDNCEARCGVTSLVLIQTVNFEKQWHNLPPMGNWEYLQQHCSVKKVRSFDLGWDLYETE